MALYIPVIQGRYVRQGLFSEPKFAALLASGAVDFDTIDSIFGANRRVGDYVTVPQFVQVPTPTRVDITTTSAASFTAVSSQDQKAVILRDFTPYSWQRHDEIRTGEDFSMLASQTVGNVIAKRKIQQLNRILQGSMAVSGVSHTKDVSLVSTGEATVDSLRATRKLLGDQADRLQTLLIHSAVWYDLCYDLVNNYKYMGQTSGEIIMDGQLDRLMGLKTIIISDDLTAVAGTGSEAGKTIYNTYLLADSAFMFAYQREPEVETFVDPRVPSTLFSEKVSEDYVIHPHGFTWGGSSNPLDTDLSSSGNWSTAYEDSRNVRICVLQSLGGVH